MKTFKEAKYRFIFLARVSVRTFAVMCDTANENRYEFCEIVSTDLW